MKKVNYVLAFIAFCVTFGLVNWYEELRGTLNVTVVDQAIFQNMTTGLAFMLGGLVALLVAVLSYKTGKREENELLRDFILEQLNVEEKSKLEQLDEYQKTCFYSVYKENFSKSMKDQFDQYVNASRSRVKHIKTIKKIVSLIVCLVIAILLNPTYQAYVEAKDAYTAQVAQAEAEAEALRQQQEAEYNQIIEDQVLYYDGLPAINLISNNTFRKGMVEDYINQYIRTQPQFLLDQCPMINLCSSECFIDQCNLQGVGLDAKSFGETYAFALEETKNIFVQIPKDDEGQEYTTDYDKTTVCHELSHIYDYNHWISESYNWQVLYSQYASSISDYATADQWECFAEAAELYVNSPEKLQNKCMEIFNFINSYYQMY